MTTSYTGFNSFGKEVPQNRRVKAYNFLKSTLPNAQDIELEFILGCGIRAVEKDRVSQLMDDVKSYLDVTGYYRLLAELCVD